jgi:hypothetical protein
MTFLITASFDVLVFVYGNDAPVPSPPFPSFILIQPPLLKLAVSCQLAIGKIKNPDLIDLNFLFLSASMPKTRWHVKIRGANYVVFGLAI